ncbi:hypothetical protein BAUCODRAFT_145212 [Baudoinia panamericana UAMH 10762]|uniref:Structure-specific endonuclease subunit SLX4 n=1 Tax=Baudoinia panamericana (strain UAMH 10762) TaxID=717646 RepID=M2NK97_BAUPA|nr:uncharacterized protein BAUCODRAFT_145212 [Baudoinia panamericana UAMH 10762]EMC99859.1 hypothetical protein BAUCODRAFT_145212 [Baudoinia panamericana UAMH 10762]
MADYSSPQLPSPSALLSTIPAGSAAKSIVSRRPMAHAQRIEEATGTPRVPLSELLGNFNYKTCTSPSSRRSITGEAMTKRRRIELVETSTVSVVTRKSRKRLDPAVEKPKRKPKAPKRAQTITEVATKAYRLVKPVETAPTSTVSEYFASTKEVHEPAKAVTEVQKAKKPRKPRSKPAITGDEPSKAPAKKPGRTKKAEAMLKEADQLPPLYSPERANRQAQQQQFLFGTSSQLAVEESPTFVKKMHTALLESEGVPAPTQMVSTQALVSPAQKSYLKVPTAPHGTTLSVGQAEREHWCAASRDVKGELLRDESRPKHTGSVQAAKPSTAKPVPKAAPASVIHPSPPKQEWVAIDDIEDESPPTPSPPRRRASASPSPVLPLAFDRPTAPPRLQAASSAKPSSPDVKVGCSVLSHNTSLKPTDAQWQHIKPTLFPQVTAAIKSAPRSTDPEKPSWHQKILLYDPLVLEDFTAWLTDVRKLRIEVQRQPRPKKGRKKKVDVEPAESVLVETMEEPLQHWMVQKWCEEGSICCLSRESSRGGLKARY